MMTAALAAFAADFPAEDVPEKAIDRAGQALVDTVGVACAGSGEEVAVLARLLTGAATDRAKGNGTAAVWASGERRSAPEAAFLNAVHAHALDFDDSSPALRGHPSCTLMPAALAAGEAASADGRAVLAAYAVGLEVGARVSAALGPGHYLHGWHTTATAGLIGATAIAARLGGLDAGATRHAFGIAASRAGGLVRNFGTMTKPLHAGDAARHAVEAAMLARAGFTADENILDEAGGFLAVYGRDGRSPDLDGLGQRWVLADEGIFVKRWPCCYAVHRPVALLREIVAEYGLQPQDIREIVVGFLPGVEHPLKYRAPRTGAEARFSIEYAMAATLLDGEPGLASFADAAVVRPEVAELMARVRRITIPHEGVFSGVSGFTEITVETSSALVIRRRSERTPGAPDQPLTGADEAAKFLACARQAMSPERARTLLARLRAAADSADMSGIFAAPEDARLLPMEVY